MSDSLVTGACVVIGMFAAAVYVWTAWPFFLAVAAICLACKMIASGLRLLKSHIVKPKRVPDYL